MSPFFVKHQLVQLEDGTPCRVLALCAGGYRLISAPGVSLLKEAGCLTSMSTCRLDGLEPGSAVGRGLIAMTVLFDGADVYDAATSAISFRTWEELCDTGCHTSGAPRKPYGYIAAPTNPDAAERARRYQYMRQRIRRSRAT